MEIYSRVKPSSINAKEYQMFLNNDKEHAFRCAFNRSILKSNQVTPVYDDIEYEILSDDIIDSSEPINIVFKLEYDLNVKLSKILRQKLSISSSTFSNFIDTGYILSEENIDLNKVKIRDGMKLTIVNPELVLGTKNDTHR